MRLLHIADLHLGRLLHGRDLAEDHGHCLQQMTAAICSRRPDALVIAGDIFDRAVPPASAVRLFNDFIRPIATQTSTAIVMIAGNHDSGDRIASLAALADRSRVLVRGAIENDAAPLVLSDAHGPVAFSALPFGTEYAARQVFSDLSISTPADVLSAQIAAARRAVPAGARWVVTAHAFVTGAQPSESERKLVVGGIETVPVTIFDGAHYVALGHLHRPQTIGAGHVRYAGSPLSFGFDEAGAEKSMSLVDLSAEGTVKVEALPLLPLHHLRTLTGKLADLIAAPAKPESAADYLNIILTDSERQIDAMNRIRDIHPNALMMTYQKDLVRLETKSIQSARSALSRPEEMIDQFLESVRDSPMDAEERTIAAVALERLRQKDAAL